MSEPIVIDDGGSTRIKKLPGATEGSLSELDGLLNVVASVHERARSSAVARSSGDQDYSAIRIAFVDSKGRAFDLFDGPRAFSRDFQIVSGNYNVLGELVPNSRTDVGLTVDGPGGCPPLVEAKQQSGRRRYIVTNAPPIAQVFVDGDLVYSANDLPRGIGPAIYTSVAIV